jgi:hypothetical protein
MLYYLDITQPKKNRLFGNYTAWIVRDLSQNDRCLSQYEALALISYRSCPHRFFVKV